MFEQVVEFKLNDDEVRDYADRLAHLTHEITDKKVAKAAENRARNEVIKDLEQQAEDLASKIVNKAEMRPVPCEWQKDLKLGVKYMVRQDTMDILETRELTEEEKQLDLQEGE